MQHARLHRLLKTYFSVCPFTQNNFRQMFCFLPRLLVRFSLLQGPPPPRLLGTPSTGLTSPRSRHLGGASLATQRMCFTKPAHILVIFQTSKGIIKRDLKVRHLKPQHSMGWWATLNSPGEKDHFRNAELILGVWNVLKDGGPFYSHETLLEIPTYNIDERITLWVKI